MMRLVKVENKLCEFSPRVRGQNPRTFAVSHLSRTKSRDSTPSRRMVNVSYVLWVSAHSTLVLCLLMVVDNLRSVALRVVVGLVHFTLLCASPHAPCPRANSSIRNVRDLRDIFREIHLLSRATRRRTYSRLAMCRRDRGTMHR